MEIFHGRRRLSIALAGLVGGGVMALGQEPLSWPLALLVGFLFLGDRFLRVRSARRAALLGWSAGLGYFGASLYWIVDPFLVEPDVYGWMAPFALVLMAGGLALFWGGAFAATFLLARPDLARPDLARPDRRAGGAAGPARWPVLLLPLVLTLAEMLRGTVLTGFPWGLPAYGWIGTPVAQLLAWVGPYGLTLITLLLAVLPLVWHRAAVGLFVSASAIAGLWLWGDARLSADQPVRTPELRLRLIQPNAPQAEKWDPQKMPIFFRRQLDLTAADPSFAPDLVIWPETAVPFWLGERPGLQRLVADSAPPGARVIIGARRAEGRRFFNSLALLGRGGQVEQGYDKAHLVPFGEYMPFGSFFSRLGITGLAAEEGGGFSAGPGAALLDLGKAGKVRPLICYEAIFPGEITRGIDRPDWMLQITNDAWFGKYAGPRQHLAQARARAIEQGLPMVRVANTGITAVIGPRGQLRAQLPPRMAGKLDTTLPSALAPTLYSRMGDMPVLLFSLLGGFLLGWRRRQINH